MKNELTELQQKTLDCLFDDEIQGKLRRAMLKAGYSENCRTTMLMDSEPFRKALDKQIKRHISKAAARAAFSLEGVMDDPTALGVKEVINVSKDLLDRSGHAKTDKVEVKAEGGVFILPAKATEEDG